MLFRGCPVSQMSAPVIPFGHLSLAMGREPSPASKEYPRLLEIYILGITYKGVQSRVQQARVLF